jgi:hypothetical protein
LGLEVDEVEGGHMVALSNPKALADQLEAFLLDIRNNPDQLA